MSAGSTPVVQSAPRTAYPMPPTETKAAAESNRTPHGWTLLDNSHQKLANYTGQVVVLDFYATWCQPCREEVPHLVQLQKQYEARGLRVIGLNVGGADDRDKVPGFVKEFGIPTNSAIQTSRWSTFIFRRRPHSANLRFDRRARSSNASSATAQTCRRT
jgi:thiol-disulfide isomerase/thioredoxin